MICFWCEKEIPFGDLEALLMVEINAPVCGVKCAHIIAELMGKPYIIVDDKGCIVKTNSFRMN